jgi:hypothetical protein
MLRAAGILSLTLLVHAQESLPAAGVVLHGKIRDARSGEPIAKALVSIRESRQETVTDEAGLFSLRTSSVGEIELYVSTVGYGLVRKKILLESGGDVEVDILLGPEAITRTDEITVNAAVFEPIETGAATERTLNHTELKNLAGVIVDDPLRAVQGLPGVSAGDDFSAEFAVRGSGFNSIGFYIDGVLVATPFHTVYGVHDGGSLTILNGDLVETLSLIGSAPPARFGDRTGAVLSVQIREGEFEKFHPRGNVSSTGLWFTGDGPIGKSRKAAWVASVRKSYFDYIVERVTDDAALAYGYFDIQGKFSYRPTSQHQLNLTVLHGNSGLTRDRARAKLGVNSLYKGNSQSDIMSLQWRWLPSGSTLLQSQAYLARDEGENINSSNELLFRQQGKQPAFRMDLSQEIGPHNIFEVGLLDRRMEEQSLKRSFDSRLNRFVTTASFFDHTWQPGGYVQDTWTLLSGKLALTAGMRVDHLEFTGQNVWLPRAGLSLALNSRTSLTAGYGQYAGFPALPQLLGENNNPILQAERSTQCVLGLEHLITNRFRIRLEAYQHWQRDQIFTAEAEYRLVSGRITAPRSTAPLLNSLRGYARGVELLLQRRSANRLSGWVSYSYGTTRLRDDSRQLSFVSDFDQIHTLNIYGSYRATRTLNFSAKYRYGSNYPIPGFYRQQGTLFFLSAQRNTVRVPVYSRLDFRINKAFFFDRWKMTLFFEAVNLLNRKNLRYTGLDRVYTPSGQVTLNRNSLLPIMPTAGLLFEF